MSFCCPCKKKKIRRIQDKDQESVKSKSSILQNQKSTSSNQDSNVFIGGNKRSTKPSSVKFIRQKVTGEIQKIPQRAKKRILDSDLIFSLGLKKIQEVTHKDNLTFDTNSKNCNFRNIGLKQKNQEKINFEKDQYRLKKNSSEFPGLVIKYTSSKVQFDSNISNSNNSNITPPNPHINQGQHKPLITLKHLNKGGSVHSSAVDNRIFNKKYEDNVKSSPALVGRNRISSVNMVKKHEVIRKGSERFSPSPKNNNKVSYISKHRMSVNQNFAKGFGKGKGSFKISDLISGKKNKRKKKRKMMANSVFRKLRQEENYRSEAENKSESEDDNQTIRSGFVGVINKKGISR